MAQVPTVELHRHFEAGLRPETLARLAEKNGVSDVFTRSGIRIEGVDPRDPESIKAYYRAVARDFKAPGGFARFVDSFGLPLSVLCSLEDLEVAAYEQIVALAQAGSLHSELRGSAMTYQARIDASVPEIIEALRAGVRRAYETDQASGTFIVSFSRQNALGPEHGPRAKRQAPEVCAAVAEAYDPEDPIGLDIAGFPEIDYPPRMFEAVTAPVREAGVPITIHCGEQGHAPDYAEAPPHLVREAVEVLGARRVGHGLCLAADPDVRALVRDRAVGVECCPGSNLRMGFIDRFEDHPLPLFLQEGLRASLSTDDPLMFGDPTVSHLLERCAEPLGLDVDRQRQLADNGIATAFVSEARRAQLLRRLHEA